MKIMRIKLHLSRRIKLLLTASLIIVGTSGATAFGLLQRTSADEMSPIQATVQDHENRIQKNEKDIVSAKDQAASAEQKADDASQAAASAQDRVTIVERKVETPAVQSASPPAARPSETPAAPQVVQAHCITTQGEIDCKTGKLLNDNGHCYVNFDRTYEIDCVTREVIK